MTTSTVIGPFDPGDDREVQILSRFPTSRVEHVVLQQRVERLHRGVVARRRHPSHRADESVIAQHADEGFGTKYKGGPLAGPRNLSH